MRSKVTRRQNRSNRGRSVKRLQSKRLYVKGPFEQCVCFDGKMIDPTKTLNTRRDHPRQSDFHSRHFMITSRSPDIRLRRIKRTIPSILSYRSMVNRYTRWILIDPSWLAGKQPLWLFDDWISSKTRAVLRTDLFDNV